MLQVKHGLISAFNYKIDTRPLLCGAYSCVHLKKKVSIVSGFQAIRQIYSTHCGLVTPYVNIDLGQHWLKQWLGAWWHQAMTWNNVDFSLLRFSGIHQRAIS